MKVRNLSILFSGLLLLPALAHSGDGDINSAVAHFASIGTALAADNVDGIPTHASAMLQMMDEHHASEEHPHGEAMKEEHKSAEEHPKGEAMKDEHESAEEHPHGDAMKDDHASAKGAMGEGMPDMKAMEKSMRSALTVLSNEKTEIKEAREAYETLGKHFIPMAQNLYEKSEQDPDWAIMNCPMVEADWIQVDGDVANPFYGSDMLSCGKKVASLGAGDKHGDHPKSDKKHDMKNH